MFVLLLILPACGPSGREASRGDEPLFTLLSSRETRRTGNCFSSTGYWRDQHNVMKEFPVNYFDELVGQSSYFASRFKNYTSFSHSTFEVMLTDEMKGRIDHIFHTNTTSSQVLWNEGETFRWEELPPVVQVSPVTRTLVRD